MKKYLILALLFTSLPVMAQHGQQQNAASHHAAMKQSVDSHHEAMKQYVDSHHAAMKQYADSHHAAIKQYVDSHHAAMGQHCGSQEYTVSQLLHIYSQLASVGKLMGISRSFDGETTGRCTGKLAFGNDRIQIMSAALIFTVPSNLAEDSVSETLPMKLQLTNEYEETTTAKGTLTRGGNGNPASFAVDVPYYHIKISGTIQYARDYVVVNAKDDENYQISGILKCRYK